MLTLRVSTKSRLGLIAGAITRSTAKAAKRLAVAVPVVCQEEIDARIKPDGSPQQQNSAATQARKGHNHPLVDTRRLRDPRYWRIRQLSSTSYDVEEPEHIPPKERARLRMLGYDWNRPARSRRYQERRRRIAGKLRLEIVRR